MTTITIYFANSSFVLPIIKGCRHPLRPYRAMMVHLEDHVGSWAGRGRLEISKSDFG